ncbi:MAG: peptidoglycan DD-metalloendopeptidase family protein [Caulobacteraceae bacterium]|nr:peptidoglycan DD-metalloendopeptidase family protein [Caulobacteraceae bacterium]
MVRRIPALVLLACAGLAASVAASAPPARQNTRNNPALRAVEADQAGRERDLEDAMASADAARAEITQLEAQLAEMNAAQASGERGVSDRQLRLAGLNAQERDLEARLGGDQARLARLLGALELFRRDPPPALFVKPTDIRDAVRAAILIRAITPELEARAAALKAQLKALQAVRRQVDTTSADLLVRQSDLAERRARIETLIAQKTVLQHRADAEAEAARQDVAALAARARALRELTQGVAAAPAPSATEPPDPEHAGLFGHPKPFVQPVPGAPARRFGDLEPGGRAHAEGWTWRAGAGAPVLAPAQGVVEYAGPLKDWGLVLILRLGGGYHLVLAGLESVATAPGRMVAAGQPVGRMADKGQSGSDLYFEIRRNGAPVDPARWLKAAPQPSGAR